MVVKEFNMDVNPYTLEHLKKHSFWTVYLCWGFISPFLTLYQKADDKIFICNFSKNVVLDISYSEFKDWRANSVDLDEVAHSEPG